MRLASEIVHHAGAWRAGLPCVVRMAIAPRWHNPCRAEPCALSMTTSPGAGRTDHPQPVGGRAPWPPPVRGGVGGAPLRSAPETHLGPRVDYARHQLAARCRNQRGPRTRRSRPARNFPACQRAQHMPTCCRCAPPCPPTSQRATRGQQTTFPPCILLAPHFAPGDHNGRA